MDQLLTQQRENVDHLLTQQRENVDHLLTLQHAIIYIYAVESKVGPRFGFS